MKNRTEYKFIAIEGNIGAGKSSLAKLLAGKLNAKLILEEFEDNSFLPKFYEDQDRYAFPLELSFLAERYNQLRKSVFDRDLFFDLIISDYFVAKSLIFAQKTLKSDEYRLYHKLFEIIHQSMPKPDLFVYLHVDVDNLLENIRKRGRDYEQSITKEYLTSIQDSYFSFIKQNNLERIVVIDTNNIDFVNNKADYSRVEEVILSSYSQGIHRVIL
ncbi:MAG: deoxynucleoside kinase [Bacteroidales bacterium]|nr:deoxynucleoside kinase [Bacteroidales bacterium]